MTRQKAELSLQPRVFILTGGTSWDILGHRLILTRTIRAFTIPVAVAPDVHAGRTAEPAADNFPSFFRRNS